VTSPIASVRQKACISKINNYSTSSPSMSDGKLKPSFDEFDESGRKARALG
jgi:hypothetical protein